ncbi:MAG: LysR family transcriptional regulator [Proteobacteria bacterium]|nr:LysR family transcriptional regulator [Pseudomonadota bacterium]
MILRGWIGPLPWRNLGVIDWNADLSAPLPPFILMQTIEAVTRLGSLKRAAEEMNVTPSAISHRVRLVEEQFGQRLFERDGQGIRSTENSELLAAAVSKAIGGIDAVWRELTARPEGREIRLCAMSAFAEEFILSNHQEFHRRFPDFRVESTSATIAEGGMRGEYDILIGIGPYPGAGWDYEDIMPYSAKIVCAPQVLDQMVSGNVVLGPILNASSDFLPWDAAANELGINLAKGAEQIRFDSVLTACHAAVRGKGVALAPAWIADKQVRQGDLVTIGNGAFTSSLSYWIAVRKSRKLDSTYGKFRRWLDAAVARTVAGTA